MSKHFSMGAINKTTNNYEYPKIANKSNKYKCPFCEKDVIFRNGKIKQPHFAHYKSINACSYYEKPNETQIHKDAKLLMKTLLNNKREICFHRKCCKCRFEEPTILDYKILKNDYNDNVSAVIEYRFNYNNSNRSADVALLQNKELKFIFEICHTNGTKEENRPEPWFEINATNLINKINSDENINEEIQIECIRYYKCDFCKDIEDYEIKRQIKENEQNSEKNELLDMSKEDMRRIQILRRLHIQQKIEVEREKQRVEKLEREKEKRYREKEKRDEKEKEYMIKHWEKDDKCSVCKINYCKCDKPNFVKNEYNKTTCNSCKKYKCMCNRITNFFVKK